jgi:hypothetical protein
MIAVILEVEPAPERRDDYLRSIATPKQPGAGAFFKGYRLRIAALVRDYDLHDREQAPSDSIAPDGV